MNYYLISQDNRGTQIVLPMLDNQSEIWDSNKPLFVPGQVKNENQYSYFLPFIETPLFMVSDRMKKILEIYQNKTLYRPCALGLVKSKKVQVYWFIRPKTITCLTDEIQSQVLYSEDDIVLEKEKIKYNKVFQIDTFSGTYFVIDEEVLEHLLRSGITEFRMTRLKTTG